MTNNQNSLTEYEIDELERLLGKCTSEFLPARVFNAIARLTVLTAIEFIPLRKMGDKIQVLLTPRPKDDKYWPNMMHTPGTILRPSDQSFETAFARLTNEELGLKEYTEPIFLGLGFGRTVRGSGVGIEYLIILSSTPKHGTFYDVDNLPPNFIIEQKPMLEKAIEKFTNL